MLAVLAQAWLVAMEAGYGPRYERSAVVSDTRRGFSTHETAHAGTLGFSVARSFGPLLLNGSARAPPFFNGEWTLGVGGGFEARAARAVRVGALVTVGYGGFTANACECGRLQYAGAFARGDVTLRYRVLEDNLGEHALPSFDVFLALALGATMMRAHYPDMSQYGLHLEDNGVRVGPHATVAVGFEF